MTYDNTDPFHAFNAFLIGFESRGRQLAGAGVKGVPPLCPGFALSASAVAAAQARYAADGIPELAALHFWRAGQKFCDLACAFKGTEIPAALELYPDAPALRAPEIKSPLSGRLPLLEEIARAAARLSPGQRRLLSEFNLRTQVGRRLAEFDAGAAKPVRGFPEQLTMEYGLGYFHRWESFIAMPQEYRSRPAQGAYIDRSEAVASYLHECGHALSRACQDFSDWDIVARAYATDVARLPNLAAGPVWPQKTPYACVLADRFEPITVQVEVGANALSNGRRLNLCYYLEEAEGGTHASASAARNEAVAELFAIGASAPDPVMTETFAETAAALERVLGAIECEMARPPDLAALLPENWWGFVNVFPKVPKAPGVLPGLPPA